jgi:hypothetical protein
MSERESNDLAFPDPAFAVRLMRPAEMDCIRTWATAEGWNPGVHDGPCFFATDPEGFFVGEMDGQPASCISCVAYDDSFGFLGQYIVKPEFRGRGYGIRTWKTGVAHLGLRNVGLDGVWPSVPTTSGRAFPWPTTTSATAVKGAESARWEWSTSLRSHFRTSWPTIGTASRWPGQRSSVAGWPSQSRWGLGACGTDGCLAMGCSPERRGIQGRPPVRG